VGCLQPQHRSVKAVHSGRAVIDGGRKCTVCRQAVRAKSSGRKTDIVCSKMPLPSRKLEGKSNSKDYQFLCSSSSHLLCPGLSATRQHRQQSSEQGTRILWNSKWREEQPEPVRTYQLNPGCLRQQNV